jgi:hypothetical protein
MHVAQTNPGAGKKGVTVSPRSSRVPTSLLSSNALIVPASLLAVPPRRGRTRPRRLQPRVARSVIAPHPGQSTLMGEAWATPLMQTRYLSRQPVGTLGRAWL